VISDNDSVLVSSLFFLHFFIIFLIYSTYGSKYPMVKS